MRLAGTVAEVQWHPSQKVTWLYDGQIDFHVRVDGLGEIAWWILGYGDQVEVVSGLEPGERFVARGGFSLKAELGKESFGDGHGH